MTVRETIIILKTIVRSRSFTILFIALMILSATTTAILLVIDYIGDEAKYIANKIVFPKTPISISIYRSTSNRTDFKTSDYVKGCLEEAKIIVDNETIDTNIIVLNSTTIDKLKELKDLTIKLIDNYNRGLIIPSSLTENIGLIVNKQLKINISNMQYEYKVIGVYDVKSMRINIPILINTSKNNRCNYTIIMGNYYIDHRRKVLLDTIDYLNNQLKHVAFNWSLMFSAIYVILAVLLIQKFFKEILDKFKLLIVQGLDLGINIVYAFFIIALIINTAGMGLGLVTIDSVMWISRFLGMIFPFKPILTIEAIAVVFVYSVILSFTAHIMVESRLRGRGIV